MTTGVEGSSVDLLLLDDVDDKRSQRRDEVRGAVVDTFLTRLEPGHAVLAIATKWHPDDLCGFFSEDAEARTRWTHLEMRIPDDLSGIEASELGAGPKIVLPLGWRAAVTVPEALSSAPEPTAEEEAPPSDGPPPQEHSLRHEDRGRLGSLSSSPYPVNCEVCHARHVADHFHDNGCWLRTFPGYAWPGVDGRSHALRRPPSRLLERGALRSLTRAAGVAVSRGSLRR